MKRETGYYWVRPIDCVKDFWIPMKWVDDQTHTYGGFWHHQIYSCDRMMDRINETRMLNPGEKSNDLDIAKTLMEKFSFNDLIKDGNVMDGSFDITVMELLQIIKHFQ